MDRRQKKTKEAIFAAFRYLLAVKRYDRITVQDILDGADIGRSTFYAHFDTKDRLLEAMCEDMFAHIFDSDPCPYDGGCDLTGQLAHILWHIREDRELARVLQGESGELFMTYLKSQLTRVFALHRADFHAPVPTDYLEHHLVTGFAETVRFWVMGGMTTTPEQMAGYFMAVTETH